MKCGIDVNVLARQVPNWNVLLKIFTGPKLS
jgi:hypothetical protein